jgi:NAD(P)-dependent dehydrogenase (short-subunit alcohol dehydrogenase family)
MMAAKLLANEGHAVTLHARNEARAEDARTELPAADGVLVGDLSTLAGIRGVAEQANAVGPFDAVIHNAGVGYREPRVETADGLEHVFVVNVLAPYANERRAAFVERKRATRRAVAADRANLGAAGGRARDRQLSDERKREIGRQGAQERWRKWRERRPG